MGTVDDFELKFQFRMFGPKANSGMELRSQVRERGLVHGYQTDITIQGKSLGGIWDEYGPRNSLAARGEKVVIDENGKKTVTQFADPDELMKGVDLEQWNEYHIIARGPHIMLKINGPDDLGADRSRERQGCLLRCLGHADHPRTHEGPVQRHPAQGAAGGHSALRSGRRRL